MDSLNPDIGVEIAFDLNKLLSIEIDRAIVVFELGATSGLDDTVKQELLLTLAWEGPSDPLRVTPLPGFHRF